jgi:hypothetical protein
MKPTLPTKKVLFSMLSLIVVISLLVSVVPVLAAGSDPVSFIPGLGRVNNATLIKMHQKEGTWFNDQEALLKEADALAVTFTKLIASEAAKKKNVSILNEGLAVFESEIAASRAIHTTAGAAIFATTGFKVNGDVRDRLIAGQQLLDGHASLADAHFRLTTAMADLGKSFKKWRHDRIQGAP